MNSLVLIPHVLTYSQQCFVLSWTDINFVNYHSVALTAATMRSWICEEWRWTYWTLQSRL